MPDYKDQIIENLQKEVEELKNFVGTKDELRQCENVNKNIE